MESVTARSKMRGLSPVAGQRCDWWSAAISAQHPVVNLIRELASAGQAAAPWPAISQATAEQDLAPLRLTANRPRKLGTGAS